jgi:hypothetical protein
MKHHAALRSALTWTRANGGARRAIAEVQPEDMAAAAVKFITGPCWMCRADSGVGGEGSCGLIQVRDATMASDESPRAVRGSH